MHGYRVVERWQEKSLCVLRCSRGHFHLARALRAMPELDAMLTGDKPHLGFGLLTCGRSKVIFRFIFEVINDAKLAPGSIWTSMEPANSVWPSQLDNWKQG